MGTQSRTSRPGVVFVSYNGLLDPLGQSQVLPYLERLNHEWPVHILSFERKDKLANEKALAAMKARLESQELGWTGLRYHQKPSLPATTYDMISGVIALRRIMAKKRIGLVHARGYVPMEIATNATRRVPKLFDIRGLQAEEYVDAGWWKEGELKWRLAKRSEARFFRRASGAVVLTEAIRPYVRGKFAEVASQRGSLAAPPVEVVPCCVDLDRFAFQADARKEWRAKIGVDDSTIVFVYSGSLGSWYLADEMARFVRAYRDRTKSKVFLLWTVNNDEAHARAATERAGLGASETAIVSSTSDEVPGVLSAADVGLALIRPCFSKRGSSPTKYAEYLAVGLPIVIKRDVGDGVEIEQERGAVALEAEPDEAGLFAAVDRLVDLQREPRTHCRDVAERMFDVNRVAIPVYRRLYDTLIH